MARTMKAEIRMATYNPLDSSDRDSTTLAAGTLAEIHERMNAIVAEFAKMRCKPARYAVTCGYLTDLLFIEGPRRRTQYELAVTEW